MQTSMVCPKEVSDMLFSGTLRRDPFDESKFLPRVKSGVVFI
jgi:hypothetical protein